MITRVDGGDSRTPRNPGVQIMSMFAKSFDANMSIKPLDDVIKDYGKH